MGGSHFLVWGMTMFLAVGSFDSVLSRTDLWYPDQITGMIEGLRPSLIHISSNSLPMRPNSVEESSHSQVITEKNTSPSVSGKSQQQVPTSPEQKPAILVPEVPNKDNGQVIVAYKSKIDETQNLLRTINESQLSKEQHDTYASITSFLEKAQEAFSQNDLSMAVNLSEKAHTLAKEIVNNSTKP